MVTIKVKRNTYGGEEYLHDACKYVANPDRAIDVGGYGVAPYNADNAFDQMMINKAYFGKTSGNPLVHVIVSYDSSVVDNESACKLSQQCAGYYADNYQVLYCTHKKDRGCSHYHTHMVINSVSCNNGMMFNSSIENMNHFRSHVSQITGQKCRLYFEK